MVTFIKYSVVTLLLMVLCAIPFTVRDGVVGSVRTLPVRVQLLFAGDLMQHLPQVTAARCDSNVFDYSATFEALRPRFEAADMVVVNLETTLTRRRNYTGYPRFRSPVVLAEAMRTAGVDVAVLANNHCCDGDGDGVRTTAEVLDEHNIRRTGVFADSIDYANNNPLYLMRRGICFALLNYTYGTNGISVPRGVIVNTIDTLQIAADLCKARAAGAQCLVVCIHWGEEYERREGVNQRYLAAYMRRHGADVVIGSHPHVIQPFTSTEQGVVFYSLGNFVSNQRKRHTDGGLLAQVDVTLHPDGRLTYTAEAIPVWVSLPKFRVLPPEVADTMSLPAAYHLFRADAARTLQTAL